MNGPLIFALLLALAVFTGFLALWVMFGRSGDSIEERLEQYGMSDRTVASATADVDNESRRPRWSGLTALLTGLGYAERMSLQLSRADLPLTAAEFTLVMLGLGLLGFLLGTVRANALVGVFIGAAFTAVPLLYLNSRIGRRRRAFTEQLPDVLTLVVGGLRSGYGLTQSLGIVVNRLDPPASAEFARILRATEFGVSVQQALRDAAERIDVDEFDLTVTAINVQYELGGNLAQTLDTIAETIRERLRILREVRVLTSHQRLTAYVLAGVPVSLAVIFFIISPEYIGKLFAPGMIRLLPIGAAVLMLIGTLIMRKIVNIEV